MKYFTLNLGDYAAATGHLSLIEHGVYFKLLNCYYEKQRPIDEALAARVIGAKSRAERDALKRILSEFFELRNGAWYNERCEREIADYEGKAEKARRSANARWGQCDRTPPDPSDRNANASSDDMRTHSERNAKAMLTGNRNSKYTPVVPKDPAMRSHPEQPSLPGLGLVAIEGGKARPERWRPSDADFDAFWKSYPKKVGKDAAKRSFDRKVASAEIRDSILDAVNRQKLTDQWARDRGQYIPNPATWLNQGRWQDDDGGAGDLLAADL